MSAEGTVLSSSPWGKVKTDTPQSFSQVLSEELAAELQQKEEDNSIPIESKIDLSQFLPANDQDTSNDLMMAQMLQQEFDKDSAGGAAPQVTAATDKQDTENDLLMAQMLQHEFDKDYDKEIQIKENKINSQSKVRVTYDKYRVVHPQLWDEDHEEEEVEERVEKEEEKRNFRGRGVSGKGKNIVTKHDPKIWGQRHADRMMDQFPPEMNTGDTVGMNMKLPNRVYNKLKTHTKSEAKRSQRLHEKKEHATVEHAMDQKTRLLLYKLVNNGTLDDVNGIISAGKESVVYHGNGCQEGEVEIQGSTREVPNEVAIKVFKTVLTDFKNRAEYMKGDPRFFTDEFKKQNPRKVMRQWADKEVSNLQLMKKYGLPCPRVVTLKKHVLVMSFIGSNKVAAPKIKDAKLSVADIQMAYEQCVSNMKKMYRQCQLVHADLSEYNMLWHNNTLYLIDVSQAVDRAHPHAHEFLLRDCRNVVQFFKKKGAVGVPGEHELFNEVTGLEFYGAGNEFLMQVEEYEKNEEKLRTGTSTKHYPFDFFFDKAQRQKTAGAGEDQTASPGATQQADQNPPLDRLSEDFELLGNDESSSSSDEDDDDLEDQWVLVGSRSEKKLLTVERETGDVGGATQQQQLDDTQPDDPTNND